MPKKKAAKKAKKKVIVKRKRPKQKQNIKVVHLTNSLAHIILWLEILLDALRNLDPDAYLGVVSDDPFLTEGNGWGDRPRFADCPPIIRPRLSDCPPPR